MFADSVKTVFRQTTIGLYHALEVLARFTACLLLSSLPFVFHTNTFIGTSLLHVCVYLPKRISV